LKTKIVRMKEKSKRVKPVSGPTVPQGVTALRRASSTSSLARIGRYIGIDMSLDNPGMCCVDPVMRRLSLWFYRNRASDVGRTMKMPPLSAFAGPAQTGEGVPAAADAAPFHGWTLETRCIERLPDMGMTDVPRPARYWSCIEPLIGQLGQPQENDVVSIEHYSFGSGGGQSQTILYELGGVLRHELWRRKFPRVHEWSPAHLKKVFSGNGRATKEEMLEAWDKLYAPAGTDLFYAMGMERRKYKKVPNPLQDVVDAMAAAISGMTADDRTNKK